MGGVDVKEAIDARTQQIIDSKREIREMEWIGDWRADRDFSWYAGAIFKGEIVRCIEDLNQYQVQITGSRISQYLTLPKDILADNFTKVEKRKLDLKPAPGTMITLICAKCGFQLEIPAWADLDVYCKHKGKDEDAVVSYRMIQITIGEEGSMKIIEPSKDFNNYDGYWRADHPVYILTSQVLGLFVEGNIVTKCKVKISNHITEDLLLSPFNSRANEIYFWLSSNFTREELKNENP